MKPAIGTKNKYWMRTNELTESSGYSLQGSFTHDLTMSKMWLIQELEKIQTEFDTIYCLGSWFGNMALYLDLASRIKFKKIINVETNKHMLDVSKKIMNFAGVENVEYMLKDANTLDYRQLGKNGLVINTSLTDMSGTSWFKNIPADTLIALQARDNDPGNKFVSERDIVRKFPMSVIYSGRKLLEDPESEYNRFMIIGYKI